MTILLFDLYYIYHHDMLLTKDKNKKKSC